MACAPSGDPRLVLWDIDGTLLRAGPIGSHAFDRAVAAVLGRPAGDHRVRMGGKTDPQIALEILAFAAASGAAGPDVGGGGAGGVGDADHLPGVLAALEAEVAGAAEVMRASGRVLPGVAELLPRIHRRVPREAGGWVQSVLTGNTAANGAAKLAAFGLDRWLDVEVGAFGSDNADRNQLVPVAVERAERLRGRSFTMAQTWVVGDTPNDLACARAAGARCLLVATGQVPAAELEGLGADVVLPDLSDVEEVLAILES